MQDGGWKHTCSQSKLLSPSLAPPELACSLQSLDVTLLHSNLQSRNCKETLKLNFISWSITIVKPRVFCLLSISGLLVWMKQQSRVGKEMLNLSGTRAGHGSLWSRRRVSVQPYAYRANLLCPPYSKPPWIICPTQSNCLKSVCKMARRLCHLLEESQQRCKIRGLAHHILLAYIL